MYMSLLLEVFFLRWEKWICFNLVWYLRDKILKFFCLLIFYFLKFRRFLNSLMVEFGEWIIIFKICLMGILNSY